MNKEEQTSRNRTDRPHSSQQLRIKLEHFLQYLCSLAVIQQILAIYNRVKHTNGNTEETLDRVENAFKLAYDRSMDLCERYYQTASDNMNGQARHIVEKILTFGVGAIVIMAQLTLTVFIATINMLFNAVASGKGALEHASTSASNVQAAARQVVSDISGKVQDISRASTEKVEKHANRLLDQANRVAGSTLGVMPETDSTGKKLTERIRDLGHRISETLIDRAQGDYINSAYSDLCCIMERLNNSLSLVDMVRANKSWVAGKAEQLHTSLGDLKTSLEREAERLKENPEEALMNYLRQNSTLLSAQLNMLQEITGKLLSEQAMKKLVTVTKYIEELERNLNEAHDVHEVRDEVLKGAYDRLTDLVQWTTNFLSEQQKHNKGEDKEEKTDASYDDSIHTEDIFLASGDGHTD